MRRLTNWNLALRRFTKWDFALIGAIIIVALGLFFSLGAKGGGERAEISLNGKTIIYADLNNSEPKEWEIGEYRAVVILKDGKIGVKSSECPGGDCLRSGFISEPGQSIICLPARMIISVSGEKALDAVSG